MMVWPYVVGGVAIGATIGIYEYEKKKSKSDKSYVLQTLLKDQLVCDRLSAAELKNWFVLEKTKCKDHAIGFIIKPQEVMMKSFGLANGNELDPEHYLIQVMYDNDKAAVSDIDSNRIISMRLINFNSIEGSFKREIDERGMIMVAL